MIITSGSLDHEAGDEDQDRGLGHPGGLRPRRRHGDPASVWGRPPPGVPGDAVPGAQTEAGDPEHGRHRAQRESGDRADAERSENSLQSARGPPGTDNRNR